MPFAKPTLSELIGRIESDILSRVETGTGILRRSILRILARVFGGAVNLTYGFIDWLARQLFVTTAKSEYLAQHSLKWGKTRRQPTYSTGGATATGLDGIDIPASTIYNDSNGLEFETQALVTIAAGVATITVKANQTGADSNHAENDILTLASPIAGIDDQATVDAGGILGGENLEADDDLRDRVLTRIQNPGMGGRDTDYEQWAKDTPSLGVTRVWVITEFDGPGTVGIFFVLDNQAPIFPNPSNVAAVQANIDQHAPITAIPNVYAPTERKVGIAINLSPNTTAVQQAVKDSLVAYFRNNTNTGMVLFISQLDEAISVAAGEIDHEITDIEIDTVSVGAGNVAFGANELPTIDPADITFN